MAATYSSLVGLAVGEKYEIRRILGAGGMGVVCEAVHLDLGKRVAVKLIDKTMKESELIVTRFRREARAAGQIKSEHIVDVFDVGADPRVGLYMVMEFLVGEDLSSRLERDKRIDVKTSVMLAHQIARGLAKAHEAGVVHRDLKPGNVFLTTRDNGHMLVKLLDFGVSKLLGDDPGSARITGSGAPIGTPLYMAPEQAEGRESVDGRADVWSLGAVLYEALAGQPAFADRGSYHGTIVGILTSRPKLLHDVAPWVPPPVAAVVDAMLVHDPNARLPNAGTVAQRLLDAFPSVLPDGTGHHTAVIVSQAAAAIDATGDTEIFDNGGGAYRRPKSGAPERRPVSYPVGPPSHRDHDPSRTVADASGPPSTSMQTGTATPIGPHLDAHANASASASLGETGEAQSIDFDRTLKTSNSAHLQSAPPSSHGPVSGRPGPRPRSQTAPMPRPAAGAPAPDRDRDRGIPGSSGRGVGQPLTPAAIDPLPSSLRDPTVLTRPPKRRSPLLTFLVVLVAAAAVAVGGFVAGRRVRPELNARAFPTSAPPPAVTHPLPSASATPSAAPPLSPSALPSTTPSESVSAPPPPPTGVTSPPPRPKRLRPRAKPADSAEEIPPTTE